MASERDPQEAIKAIHDLARIECDYESALNMGRGMKQHTKNLETQRDLVFRLIVGRPPTEDERSKLLWGDA